MRMLRIERRGRPARRWNEIISTLEAKGHLGKDEIVSLWGFVCPRLLTNNVLSTKHYYEERLPVWGD